MNAPSRMSARDFRKMQGLPVDGEVGKSAGKPAIRLPKDHRSKVEIECERILMIEWPESKGYRVQYEGLSFLLPSRTRYCPDFVIWDEARIILVVECKGAYRLHSAGASHEKVKQFIVAYPEIYLRYMQKTKDGWKTVEANI